MPEGFDDDAAPIDGDLATTHTPGEDATALRSEQADEESNPAEGFEPHDDAATGAEADADEVIDEAGAPEAQRDWVRKTNKVVQKRLREAAAARKEAADMRDELAQMRREREGLALVMRSKNPAEILRMLQEQFPGAGGDGATKRNGDEGSFTYRPKAGLKMAPEAQEALTEILTDFAGQMEESFLRRMEARTRPLVEQAGRSEALVREQEWSKVRAKYGAGADRWRSETEKLIAGGMPADKALMAASDGAAYLLLQQRKVAADKARSTATPTLPPRGKTVIGATAGGSAGGRRRLADYLGGVR